MFLFAWLLLLLHHQVPLFAVNFLESFEVPILEHLLLLLRLLVPISEPLLLRLLVPISEQLLLLLLQFLLLLPFLLLLLLVVLSGVPILEQLLLLLLLVLPVQLQDVFQEFLLLLFVLHDLNQEQGSPGSLKLWLLVLFRFWFSPHQSVDVKVSCCSSSGHFLGVLLAQLFRVLLPLSRLKLACLWSSCSWASWVLMSCSFLFTKKKVERKKNHGKSCKWNCS